MKVHRLILNNFMIFENIDIDWAENINVICGENSTGKTTLLKVMYSVLKALGKGYKKAVTKKIEEKMFVDFMKSIILILKKCIMTLRNCWIGRF